MTTAKKPNETIEVTPDGEVETVPEKPRLKRRDVLVATALLRRHNYDPTDMVAVGMATEFLMEKKNGETDLTFPQWMDEDMPDQDEEEEEDEDPSL